VLITTKQEITAGREYPGMHIRMGMNMSSVPTVEVDGGTVIRLGDSSMIMRILAPEIPVSELRDAVIPYPDVADDFDEWITEVDWENAFERCLASKPSIEPCRGPLGIHEWDQKEVIERRSFDDRVSVVLWVCQHCPVHLLTNFEPNGEAVPYILFGKEPDPEWGLSHLSGKP